MEKVDPIRKTCDINKIKSYLRVSNKRNYLLFVIGINTAIKSNKLLTLKLKDVIQSDYTIKEHIIIDEVKHYINESINLAVTEYIDERVFDLDTYLFESQKSKTPINRSHLYKILNKAVNECGIDITIGNETLRKTFGYHYYYKTGDIKYLKRVFNQNSKKSLFEYLDIDSDSEETKNFCL